MPSLCTSIIIESTFLHHLNPQEFNPHFNESFNELTMKSKCINYFDPPHGLRVVVVVVKEPSSPSEGYNFCMTAEMSGSSVFSTSSVSGDISIASSSMGSSSWLWEAIKNGRNGRSGFGAGVVVVVVVRGINCSIGIGISIYGFPLIQWTVGTNGPTA